MTPKEFRKFLARDQYCLHCGETEAVSPNHRINRGMGGSKLRDTPSNIVIICSWLNERIEGSAFFRDMALDYGWKLESWEDTLNEPVFDACQGKWFMLDDDYGRRAVEKERTIE